MTIDLRKRIEELERENAELREELRRALDCNVSALEATGMQFVIGGQPGHAMDAASYLKAHGTFPPKHEHRSLMGLDPETQRQIDKLNEEARDDMYPRFAQPSTSSRPSPPSSNA